MHPERRRHGLSLGPGFHRQFLHGSRVRARSSSFVFLDVVVNLVLIEVSPFRAGWGSRTVQVETMTPEDGQYVLLGGLVELGVLGVLEVLLILG
jgi:hypothetical protein